MSIPRVSIVMATNQFGADCRLAIQSCIDQSYTDFEVIIVANGMSDQDYDDLEQFCATLKNMRLFRSPVRRLTFSLNLGIHHARGEYIARMDSDDIAYPDRLKVQVAYLDEHPEISICGAACDLIDLTGRVVGQWSYPETDKGIRKALYHSNPICHPAVIYRREVMLENGGYCGLFAEDYVTWALLSTKPGVRFANLSQKLIAYRANHAAHARNLSWLNAKATLAGAQLQLFGMTHSPGWLLGVVLNLAKTFLKRR